MKKMIKSFVCVVLVIVTAFTMIGCGNNANANLDKAEVVRVASLKGPTSIGMVKMMDDATDKYEFNIYTAATEIAPLLISGEVDIANIPANLAATLFAKTEGKLVVLNTNTLNVLYLLGTGEEKSFEDLKGKTIYTTGKGTTPEFTLNYLIAQSGLTTDDFTIEFKSEATEVLGALTADPDGVAVLPQPFATVAMTKIEGLHIILDFAAEWDKYSPDSKVVTGVTVARKEFVDANPGLTKAFMDDIKASIDYVNANPEEMSQSVEKYDIVAAPVAMKSIPFCSLTYLDGEELQSTLNGYLEVLFNADPSSVGGAVPNEAFYYKK